MPIVMHFSTFLKFLTLNTGDKIRDLEKYAEPGGFDFYRSSRDGTMQHCAHGRSKERVISDIKASAAANTIERNCEIFEATASWLAKQAGQKLAASRGVWASPDRIFSVHIEPEIAFGNKNKPNIVAVYPRKEFRINRDQAGAGVILLKRAYSGTGEERFGVLDAFAEKAFWSPTNVSEALLDSEIATMENELKRILGR